MNSSTRPSLADFKANSANLSEKLKAKFKEEMSGGSKTADERFWNALDTRDKAGNGYAIIRFLPAAIAADGKSTEDVTYVKLYKHAFQGKGGWYIENSRTTLPGETDPCGEYNSTLWNAGSDELKEQARKQKRKTEFISNILVIDDPAHPENNGKVFLYKYGKKIFEKINDKMFPTIPIQKKIEVQDFWNGANFVLQIRAGEGGWPDYSRSEFEAPTPLGDDDKIEKVWHQQYPLLPLIAPEQFKSYDDLKKRLNRALGLTVTGAPSRPMVSQDSGRDDNNAERETRHRDPAPEPASDDEAPASDTNLDSEEIDYFKRMKNNRS